MGRYNAMPDMLRRLDGGITTIFLAMWPQFLLVMC